MTVTVDMALLFAFILYSSIGSCMRALFGIYKAYGSNLLTRITLQRVAIEVVASILFGTFASVLLNELGWVTVSMEVVAMISGFFGADLVSVISRKVGIRGVMRVQLAEEMMEYADLTERQETGIRYLKKHGRVNNDSYQKLNGISHSSAKRDLQDLLKMKRIKKHGIGRGVYYTIN